MPGRGERYARDAVDERCDRGAPRRARVELPCSRQGFDRVEQEPRGHVLGAPPQVAAREAEHAIAGRRGERRQQPTVVGRRAIGAQRELAAEHAALEVARATGRHAARTGTRPRRARTRRAGRDRRRARSRPDRRGRPRPGDRRVRARPRARAPASAGTRRASAPPRRRRVRRAGRVQPPRDARPPARRRATSRASGRRRSNGEPAGAPIPPSPTTTSARGSRPGRPRARRRTRAAGPRPLAPTPGTRRSRSRRNSASSSRCHWSSPPTTRARRDTRSHRAPGAGRPWPSRNGTAASSANSESRRKPSSGRASSRSNAPPNTESSSARTETPLCAIPASSSCSCTQARVRVLAGEQDGHPLQRHAVPHRVDHPAHDRAHLFVGIGRRDDRQCRSPERPRGADPRRRIRARAAAAHGSASARATPVRPSTHTDGAPSATARRKSEAGRVSRCGRYVTTTPSSSIAIAPSSRDPSRPP